MHPPTPSHDEGSPTDDHQDNSPNHHYDTDADDANDVADNNTNPDNLASATKNNHQLPPEFEM